MAATAVAPSPSSDWEQIRSMLQEWHSSLAQRVKSHRSSAKWRRAAAWLLGALAVIFTTLISGATSIADEAVIKGNLGIVSVLATIVTGLSSFLKFGERAERHLAQANQCHSLLVEIDFLLAAPPADDRLRGQLESIKEKISSLGIDD